MPKSQKKTAAKHINSTVLDCQTCGARAAHVVVSRVIEEHMKLDRCVICGRPFKVVSVRIEHVHDQEMPPPHFGWQVTSREITEFITDLFLGAKEPQTMALAHAKCAKRVLRHWPEVSRVYEKPITKALPSPDEVVDKLIERGVHLKALDDLKIKLKDALTGLLKNVTGSSSEFGCPCASRVASTLTDISEKFQKGDSHDEAGV